MVLRKVYLDIAKGIAIILMVAGHAPIPDMASRIIYAFHMPLFFIASGFASDYRKYKAIDYVGHKARSILVPFLCYSTAVAIIMMAIGELELLHLVKKGWGGYALWFVPVLFLSSIVAQIANLANEVWKRYVVMAVFLVVGSGLCYFKIILPWTLSTVPFASFLILLGSELSRAKKLIEKDGNYWDIFLYFIIVIVISHFWRLDLAWNKILPIVPLTIGALAGTLMTFRISVWIENHISWCSKILQAVGKETYIVVAFSQVIILLINRYFEVSPLLKYLILIVLLVALKYLKDTINKVAKTKIL